MITDRENSTSCRAGPYLKLNVQSVCCGTCDNFRTLLPSGEAAVMSYCSLRKAPVDFDECCTLHPKLRGDISE